MSEMELSIFRQRSTEAIKQKVRRGELIRTVAVGYLKTDDERIEKDADRRVQDAITLVFHKFEELQSVRQVIIWMRREQILLPAAVHKLWPAINRVEVASVPRSPPHPDEPGLCWRLRIWSAQCT